MLLFMGFIVTLVILMVGPHKADSLIEKDYYEKGQSFDLDYNARQAAKEDKMTPLIQTSEQGLTIRFPQAVTYDMVFRRLSDSKLDRSFKTDSLTKELFIKRNELRPGSWLLRIQYKAGEKNYLYQHKILLP